jgi:hypothetical protein
MVFLIYCVLLFGHFVFFRHELSYVIKPIKLHS